MSPAVQSPQVEIHDVAIDHVNVTVPKRSAGLQNLVELAPLLSTLLGLVLSFTFNLVQYDEARHQRILAQSQVDEAKRENEAASVQKVDSDWREALKNVDAHSSALLALEMETFAGDERYEKKAKSLIYPTLLKVDNEQFDAVLDSLLDNTKEDDQEALLAVVRVLSLDLKKLHDRAIKARKGHDAVDISLASFVGSPESYIADDSPDLATVNALTYKLDSVSAGLTSLWHGRKSRPALKPGRADLSGLVFLNRDYRGVDFSASSSMKESFFLGNCKVDVDKLRNGPENATVACVTN